MVPASRVKVIPYSFEPEVQPTEDVMVSPAELNGKIASAIATVGVETVIVETPGFGFHIYSDSTYGWLQGMGVSENQAWDNLLNGCVAQDLESYLHRND